MLPLVLSLASLAQLISASPAAPVGAPQVRVAVEKSLALLDKEGLEWETTKCVSYRNINHYWVS